VCVVVAPRAGQLFFLYWSRETIRKGDVLYCGEWRAKLRRIIFCVLVVGDCQRGLCLSQGLGRFFTWRALANDTMPSLPDWDLGMGDVELF